MTRYLEKYTGEKTYIFPSGGIGTKEAVLDSFPAALTITYVVETDESKTIMYAMNQLLPMRQKYGIGSEVSDDDAIAQIQKIINTPVEEVVVPTTEERTAAALEFLAMNSLPDMEV